MLTIASEQHSVELSAAELMERVWLIELARLAADKRMSEDSDGFSFGVPKVIVASSSSFALASLQLHGTLITYQQRCEIDPAKTWRNYDIKTGEMTVRVPGAFLDHCRTPKT